jgi:DNA topoisomerase-1
MAALVIVESPGKIKKISAILGAGYEVMASVGHVRDLDKKELSVNLVTLKPEYQETERGKEVLKKLRAAAGRSDTVFLATDPDREGESIAWHLAETMQLTQSARRISFNEISEKAVMAAISKPRQIDLALAAAADARRTLDRLVGWEGSDALRKISGESLTAGRVQSPAVRLVVTRERDIRNFRPTQHFGVDLVFNGDAEKWKASWDSTLFLKANSEYFRDQDFAARVAETRDLVVISCEETESRTAPKAPFTTSALQQAASAALKMKPGETMAAAQALYEQGAITYHRTDTPSLGDGYAAAVAHATGQGWPVAITRRVWKSKEGAQEAHSAIAPTHYENADAGETAQEKALYKLILKHSAASVLDDAVFAVRTATLSSSIDGQALRFVGKGRALISKGWKAVYEAAIEEGEEPADDEAGLDNPVARLVAGADVRAESGLVVSKITKAPGRFKQASLVGELERSGIGRPSTYAAILANIMERGYVVEDSKGFLSAGAPGEKLVDILAGHASFIDLDYTRHLEDSLDEIAAGKLGYRAVMTAAHGKLTADLADMLKAMPVYPCPVCQKPMSRRSGEKGAWWGCTGYPECKSTLPDAEGKPGKKEPRAPATEADKKTRIYFDVTYDDRLKAKAGGLLFDGEKKKWFAPNAEKASGVKGFKRLKV